MKYKVGDWIYDKRDLFLSGIFRISYIDEKEHSVDKLYTFQNKNLSNYYKPEDKYGNAMIERKLTKIELILLGLENE